MKPKQFDRDLHTELAWPTLSASSLNAFTFSSRDKSPEQAKEEWYKSYVLGHRLDETTEPGQIIAGKKIGEVLASDPNYLPEVPRPEIYEFTVPKIKFNNIYLTGHMDGFSLSINDLLEYKTSQSKTYWNQKSVDENKQLSFYCLLLLHKFKIRPEDVKIRLVYIPVKETGTFEVVRSDDPIKIFTTSRTTLDIIKFGVYVQKVYREMEDYVKASIPPRHI